MISENRVCDTNNVAFRGYEIASRYNLRFMPDLMKKSARFGSFIAIVILETKAKAGHEWSRKFGNGNDSSYI